MNLAKKGLCRLLVVSVSFLSIHSARAEMIATEAVTYLGRAEVASQLHSLGVERAFADDAALRDAAAALDAHGYRTHEFGDSVLIERQTRHRAGLPLPAHALAA